MFPVSAEGEDKQSHSLFSRMAPFPTKKAVTLDKMQDFSLRLTLSDKEMDHLSEDEIRFVKMQ